MGWKSDWLYRIVFAEFEQAWKVAQKQGTGRFGPPSSELVVTQYGGTEASEDQRPIGCRGDALRSWRYAGDDWEETTLPDFKTKPNPIRGMYYERASGNFHISADRKTVVIEHVFGPRYGHGTAFLVHSQGPTAYLSPKPDAIGWVS